MKQHYETLGLKLGTPFEVIRNTYKKLIKQNHPDRFQHCSLKKNEAEEKTKEINLAFESIERFSKNVEQKFLSVSALRKAIKREAVITR